MTKIYSIEYYPAARRFLQKLDPHLALRLYESIEEIRFDPWSKTVPLVNMDDQRKLRVGEYRIILTIDDDRIFVTVVKIGHRKNIYK
ncbi:type II toxin-antitoxin system RelE/ParE family toxin [Methanorbis rubei]|uniref:Type II toxin-antitoxin system RelE/ParE family toxin n=1 Tax=Methanorbis rubei TaxID=3028300 RepID=A0AAE4SDB4_9EURY|nr:hypothetical protein [Methanocorpusculaceae archaeon Cs1]